VANQTKIAYHPAPICISDLFKAVFDGKNLEPLRESMISRLQSNPDDPAVLMNLCAIDQILGNPVSGLQFQQQALAHSRLYQSYWPASSQALRVVAFMAPGNIGTNTPIGFLLNCRDVVLYSLYVVPGKPLPDPFPEHDIAIVTMCEEDANRPVLRETERLIANWPCPVLNRPDRIPPLARNIMYSHLREIPGLFMSPTIRVSRSTFEDLTKGTALIDRLGPEFTFPLIARPVDSHAGKNLVKLDGPQGVASYLAGTEVAEFFLSPFVEYRSSDGMYRKFRIVWVDGRPYPCHMAVAEDWKVWYYSAGMETTMAKRNEEEIFMTTFDDGFGRRHAGALSAIVKTFGLEYMGIDCAEMPDGRLLVFEGEVAMVAHNMDSPALYPYKGPQMQKLFSSFEEMLRRKAVPRAICV
jgi:hypothetical protein